MSQERISCAVHTKGYVAEIGFLKCSHGGSCRRDISWFRFLIGLLFLKCRGDMLHEQFTRGDLACNRGVMLFCRRDMSPQFKLIWIQGTCRADHISSPEQDFSWKLSVHTMGFVAGTLTLQHVLSCVPTPPLTHATYRAYKMRLVARGWRKAELSWEPLASTISRSECLPWGWFFEAQSSRNSHPSVKTPISCTKGSGGFFFRDCILAIICQWKLMPENSRISLTRLRGTGHRPRTI